MKPTGNVTFLFTDIEGSTRLSQEFPVSYPDELKRHNALLQKAVETNNGFVFKTVGDAFCCAFGDPVDAVKASAEAQIKLNSEDNGVFKLKIRMGIHIGNAEWSGTDYMGYITLARTQRVMSAAYGGQIIISNDTYEIVKHSFLQGENMSISFRDFGERRLKDLIEPLRLFQLNAPSLQTEFPPLKTLDARPNNIPIQLTSFIGRENEIREIKSILKTSKLLTLAGAGGTGKTRLSLQVGADMTDDFENGVFITELANVTDPFLIAEAVLDSLKVKADPGIYPDENLASFLEKKELLLILDNCEHLISKCSELADRLLKNCSRLKIIATSREALKCPGEQVYRVPSLSSPDPSLSESPEKLTRYASVRLFIERALSVNQNFRVNNDNLPALSEICFRLDGIPLAIELAAARTKTMSVEKIHERLDNCFNLLVGGNRTSLPRQQTLKALIGWSYDLISEKEKLLWSRLSVYKGGWTLESAEEICSDELLLKEEVIVVLSQLVEKSIIVYDHISERYSILETIKQFGEGKLKEAGETEKLFSRHLDYFILLAKDHSNKFSGKEAPDWLKMADAEHSNFISAIEWSAKNGKTEKAAILSDEINMFWEIRGNYLEGIRITESLLEDTSGINPETLSNLYLNTGHLYRAQGNYENAMKYFDKCIAIKRELKNDRGIILVLQSLANVEAGYGNFTRAQKLFEESLEISRRIDFESGIAFALNNLGNIALIRGNFQKAEILIAESLAINRSSGNKHRIAFSIDSMGNVMTEKGNLEEAQKYLEESLELTREVGDKSGITYALTNLSAIAFRRGNIEQAQNYSEESLKMRIELGDKNGIAYSLFNLGEIFFSRKKYDKAREYYSESLSLRLEIGDKHGIAVSMLSFSEILSKDKEFTASAKILGAAETILKSLGMDEVTTEFIKLKRLISELTVKISPEDFEEYFEEGKKLTLEEAEFLITNYKLQITNE